MKREQFARIGKEVFYWLGIVLMLWASFFLYRLHVAITTHRIETDINIYRRCPE
jgi:hypothetical protein